MEMYIGLLHWIGYTNAESLLRVESRDKNVDACSGTWCTAYYTFSCVGIYIYIYKYKLYEAVTSKHFQIKIILKLELP